MAHHEQKSGVSSQFLPVSSFSYEPYIVHGRDGKQASKNNLFNTPSEKFYIDKPKARKNAWFKFDPLLPKVIHKSTLVQDSPALVTTHSGPYRKD